MTLWLLLHYQIPAHPTAQRVYIWRKLKRLGAILLYGAVWVLPATARTREQFQWLASEIAELGGEAMLWEARLTPANQDSSLIRQFTVQVEREYQKIASELNRRKPDLAGLSRKYQQVQMTDYFQSPFGVRVREALMSARNGATR
ncbi:MAG: ChrB protein [Chloroflexi bacterium]|nr:ChrB protein [Chloroflexota bacterium]